MVAFDVDAAIAEFLSDPVCSSIKLEHMTTGQRKDTKKLLAQYPEVRCESYGFGAERQLHLFKKCADEAQQKEDAAGAKSVLASPGCSTKVSTTSSPRDLEPVELQVRNTFIHIESTPIDQRAVQSMPHGMFRQCILLEDSQAIVADNIPEFPTTPSSVFSEPEMESLAEHAQQHLPFSIGSLVVVEGLVKAPGFNGRSAVVQGWDEATGRYNIVLASPSGCQSAKIKEENLRMVLPCP